MGGAMDLVVGVKRVVVVMDHVSKAGDYKILEQCALPLTGKGCVDLIITDLGVIACDKPGLRLLELAPGVRIDEIEKKTAASLQIADHLKDTK